MGLIDKASLYDRHTREELGNPVGGGKQGGGPSPNDGNYYQHQGHSDSPFDTVRLPKMDQMVQLLEHSVTSNNHSYLGSPGSITYTPSDPGLDMNGNDFGEGFSNPLTGNYKGRYTHPETGTTY